MPRHGKNYRNAREKIDSSRLYPLEEAVTLVKEFASGKFDETLEVAANLGVDPRHADQMVRGSVVLPNGIGKSQIVVALAKGDKAAEAKEAGADFVGAEDLAEKIQGGWLEFDRVVATPDVMSVAGRLGKILGPRGMMPNPKSGSVSFDMARMVKEIKAGKVEYRVEKAGIVHAPVGKASFEVMALAETSWPLWNLSFGPSPLPARGCISAA